MQLHLQSYFWLTNNGILRADEAPEVNLEANMVVLSPPQAASFISGHSIAAMLQKLQVQRDGQPQISMDQLKHGPSVAMHTFNWKQLNPSLNVGWNFTKQDLGLGLSDSQKQAIVHSFDTQDFSLVQDVVYQIYQKAESFSAKSARAHDVTPVPRRKATNSRLSPLGHASIKKARSSNHVTNLSGQHNQLYLSRPSKPDEEEAVDIDNFAGGDLEPSETHNCLEFLLATLCRVMDLRPKQAAGLLTNNNKYLAVAVVKGLKGSFQAITDWYQCIYAESRHAAGLIEKEERSKGGAVSSMLNTLRVGFHSRSFAVAEQTCRVFARLGQQFLEAQLIGKAYEWLVDPMRKNPGGPGFLSIIELLQRENSLADALSQVLLQFGQFNLYELLAHHLVQLCKTPLQYLQITQVLFPALCAYKIAKDQVMSSGLLQFWINFSIQRADHASMRNTTNLRAVSLSFLCDLWTAFPSVIEENQDVSNGIHTMLKRGSRDASRLLKRASLLQLFRLLDSFTLQRNFFAPVIYKTLVFSLIENHHEAGTRQFMLANMARVFAQIPSIPVDILLGPFLKQIRVSEGISFAFKIFDFQFFLQVSRHHKLSLNSAIQATDILAKVYLEDVRFSLVAQEPLLALMRRFLDAEPMQEYIRELIRLFMQRLSQLENKQWEPDPPNKGKNLGGGGGPLPIGGVRGLAKSMGNSYRGTKPSVEAVAQLLPEAKLRAVRKGLILELLRRLRELGQGDFDSEMQKQLLTMNLRHKKRYNRDHRGVMALLKSFGGDAEGMLLDFEMDYLDKMRKEEGSAASHTIIQQVEEGTRDRFEDNQSEMGDAHDWPQKGAQFQQTVDRSAISQLPGRGLKALRGSRKGVHMGSAKLFVPFQKKLGRMERKAMLEIEVMRLKKEARIEKRRMEEERRKLRQKAVQQAANRELEKRRIAQGKAAIEDQPRQRSLNRSGLLAKIPKKVDVVPLDLSEEPALEQQKVKQLFRRYAKLIKILLGKYSNTGYHVRRVAHHLPSFDQSKQKESLALSELTKLLSDNYFTSAMITQDAQATILRHVNLNYTNKADTKPLMSADAFQDFLLQVAIHVYSKPPKQLLNTTPSACLSAFFEQLEFASKAKGEPISIFQEAKTGVVGNDKDVTKKLNARLAEDPETQLPEGFTKIKQKQYKPKFVIPPLLRMPTGLQISMELLSEVCHKALGFHLIEPMTEVQEVTRAKKVPVLRGHSQAPSLLGSSFLDRPRGALMNSRASGISGALQNSGPTYGAKSKLTVGMKLALAEEKDPDERERLVEVAELLGEVVEAVAENKVKLYGRSYVGKGGATRLENRAIREKRDAALQDRRDKQEREFKVEQRRKDIAKELERMREQREARKKKEAEEREKKEQREEKKRKKLAEMDLKLRQEFEAKRAAKAAEDAAKQSQQKDKKLAAEARQKRENALRLKLKQKELEAELQQLSEQNKIKREAEEGGAGLKEETKKVQKKAADKFYSKEKEQIQASRQTESDFLKFFNSPQVRQLLDAYSGPLSHLFQHYCLEHDPTAIALKQPGWKKLGAHFGLAPGVISADDLVYVFKLVAKKSEGEPALSQKLFLEALTRVATLGQYKLQGLPEPKRSTRSVSTAKKAPAPPPPEAVPTRSPAKGGKSPSPTRSQTKGGKSPPSASPARSLTKAPAPPVAEEKFELSVSVMLQEHRRLRGAQSQRIQQLMGQMNPPLGIWKQETDKLKKKSKQDITELVVGLTAIRESLGRMNAAMHSYNQFFLNGSNKQASQSIARELRMNPDNIQEMVEAQTKVEDELQRVLKQLAGVAEAQLANFLKLKGSLQPKKKNAEDSQKLDQLHKELSEVAGKIVDDLNRNCTGGARRIEQLKKYREEAKGLGSSLPRRQSTILLRKKTELQPASPEFKKSPTLAGKEPVPLRAPEFSMEKMSWKVVEKMLKETMGLNEKDSRIKTELKIKQRVQLQGHSSSLA